MDGHPDVAIDIYDNHRRPGEPVQLRRASLPVARLQRAGRGQLSRPEQRADGGPLSDTDEDTGTTGREPRTRDDLMFEGEVIDDELVVGAKFSTDHFHEADIDVLTRRIAELMRSTTGEMAS
jgi:hypothetical protein